ncbi:unnamed protein product [Lactuca saligna]|uniref:Uncharacterized protein n=1 Tax=Lactuca saligna TaxID=75948 RepID=A0AA35YHT6_LACSI|nr:unnamed protein product [Lactuca saligna]
MEKIEKKISRFLQSPLWAHVLADVHHVVGIKGYNPSGNYLIATKFFDYVPLSVPDDENIPQKKRQVMDEDNKPADLSDITSDLSLIIASGPYTMTGNLFFEPLSDLLACAQRKQPAKDTPADLSLAPKALQMPRVPYILIVPSDLTHFVKVLSLEGTSEGGEEVKCMCVKSGRLARGEGGGHFVELNFDGTHDSSSTSVTRIWKQHSDM